MAILMLKFSEQIKFLPSAYFQIKCWKWKCLRKKPSVGNRNVFQQKLNVGSGNVFERNQMLEMEMFAECSCYEDFTKKSNGNVCQKK